MKSKNPTSAFAREAVKMRRRFLTSGCRTKRSTADPIIGAPQVEVLMNNKVIISNRINRLTCGDELLYCSRVYFNARVYGGLWVEMECLLNFVFWLLRGQKQHCRASYIFERRHHAKKKDEVQTYKVTTPETEKSSTGH